MAGKICQALPVSPRRNNSEILAEPANKLLRDGPAGAGPDGVAAAAVQGLTLVPISSLT